MPYILFLFLLIFHSVHATEPSTQEIDRQLQSLKEQLQQLRKEELNAEMGGQASFRYDSPTYTKKMEQAESKENAADHLEERIKELEARKAALVPIK